MKVGTICYATSRGLGHLAHDFYLNGVVTDVMVVRHPGVPTNDEWYPDAPETGMRPLNQEAMRAFCAKMDVMLFFETPFEWSLLAYCHSLKIKTFLMTMYECTPTHHPLPYCYLCPSLLDVEYFKHHNYRLVQLPVAVPWRQRNKAEHFVHNGGYLGLTGSDGIRREGTATIIRAMQYVESPLRLTIRVQENVSEELLLLMRQDERIEYIPTTVSYETLYATGDVAIGAQKWNGCSLPLQEALASGMLVMNTDRFPMNAWLDPLPLVKPSELRRFRVSPRCLEFDEAIVDPKIVAEKMDEWYGQDISSYSLQGRAWAEENSWERLRSEYLEILSQ